MKHMYIAISPGLQPGSYISYPNGRFGVSQANHLKFGDSTDDYPRDTYFTHNPDVLFTRFFVDTTQGQGGGLGTRVKNELVSKGYTLSPGTEWFIVRTQQAWAVFNYVRNGANINFQVNNQNFQTFIADIVRLMSTP